jgi:hypothetical protein
MGDGFKVDTPHLRGYAQQLSRSSLHSSGIAGYVDGTCGDTSGWSGLLSFLVDNYSGMVSDGSAASRQLSTALYNTSFNLELTATDYDKSDHDASVMLSGVVNTPVGPRLPASGPGGTATYADTSDPTAALVAPQSYDDLIASQVDEIGGIIGLFNDVYEMITGDSLLAKIVEPVSGDWGKVYGLADAWDNVGDAYLDLHGNLDGGLSRLDAHWDGDAATAFDAFVDEYLLYLLDLKESTGTVSNALRDLAEDTKENFDVIIQTLNTVWSIISAALASFAIPLYGQAKLAKAVWDTAKLIWNIYKIINLIRQLIDFVVEMTQLVSEIFDESGELPTTAG